MDRGDFILAYLFGAPAIAAALNLAFVLLDRRAGDHGPAKRLVGHAFTAWLLAVVAVPILDLRGGLGKEEIARELFALPEDTVLEARRSRPKTPICWQDEPGFFGTARLDDATAERLAGSGAGENLRAYVARHYGLRPSDILVEAGALDWREASDAHDLHDGEYWSPTRLATMLDPFVCAAIQREGGVVTLLPCDPIARTPDTGNAGRLRLVIDREDGELDYLLVHADASTSCTNPIRRAVNALLRLEHPG